MHAYTHVAGEHAYAHMYANIDAYTQIWTLIHIYAHLGTEQGACGVNNSAGLVRSLGWRDGISLFTCSSHAILAQAQLASESTCFLFIFRTSSGIPPSCSSTRFTNALHWVLFGAADRQPFLKLHRSVHGGVAASGGIWRPWAIPTSGPGHIQYEMEHGGLRLDTLPPP